MREILPSDNPVLQAVLRRHGVRHARDLRGWLLGRGAAGAVLRLAPVLALAGSIGLERLSPWLAGSACANVLSYRPALLLALLPIIIAGQAALSKAAVAAARDWSDGRMDEWRLTRLSRQEIGFGQVVGFALPAVAGTAVGGLVAALAWATMWAVGLGGPPIGPVEGLLILVEACFTALLMAGLGTLFGNWLRRPVRALLAALVLGTPLLGAAVCVSFVCLGWPLLGSHGLLIGVLWILGREARLAAGACIEPSKGWVVRPQRVTPPGAPGGTGERDDELVDER